MRGSRVAILMLVGSVGLSQAVAQNKPLLDLTAAPGAPAAGSGAGSLALAEQLGAEAQAIQGKDNGAGAMVRAELRRLAQTLISTGERSGQAGSARVVLGRTLAGSLPLLDSAIARAEQPTLLLAADDLASARTQLGSNNTDPDLVMRDALAWMATITFDFPAVGGWIDDAPAAAPGPLTPRLDAWAKLPGVSTEAIAAIREFDAAAEHADAVYRPSASRTRAILADAIIEAAWLPDPARRILGEHFSSAATQLSSRETRGQALAALARLSRLAEVVRLVDALEDSAASKKIKVAAAQAIALPPAQTDTGTIDSYIRLLKLGAARSGWPDEKTLIRQLRPGWRILLTQARQSEQHVLTAIPEVLRRPEAMTDPGTLAAITAHRRAVADAEGLIVISRAFAVVNPDPAGEPVAAPPWVRATERVLKVCQDFSRADRKEAAQTSLRALITHVQTFWQLPGEEDLRKGVRADAGKPERASIWAKLSGGKDALLAAEITDRRAGWINAWEKGAVIGSDGDRLAALRVLLSVMADARPIVEATGGKPGSAYAALQQWPGWEISWPTMAGLSTGLTDQIAEATTVLLAGDAGKAAAMLANIRRDFPIPLLAGRLAREGTTRGLASTSSVGAAVLELTSGGPISARSWMGRWTDELDDVSRYAEEAAAARKLGARDKADAILKFANVRAGAVLDGWQRE